MWLKVKSGWCWWIFLYKPFVVINPTDIFLFYCSSFISSTPSFAHMSQLITKAYSPPSASLLHPLLLFFLHPAQSYSCQTQVLASQADKRHWAAIISSGLIRKLSLTVATLDINKQTEAGRNCEIIMVDVERGGRRGFHLKIMDFFGQTVVSYEQ